MNNLSPRTKYIYTRQCLHQINNLITGHPQAQQLRRRDEFEKWRNARRRHWVETYKVRKGCYICGYKAHPDGLFFRSLGKDKRNFSVILKLSPRPLLTTFGSASLFATTAMQSGKRESEREKKGAIRDLPTTVIG